jgi:glycosyltransferase involved in cell wall biosynthesis
MWLSQRIAVVIPAYREALLIGRTLSSLPAFVDAVFVVDDASDDATSARANAVGDARVRCLRHTENRGVGAAIVTGYRAALADGADVIAVMGGDNQMDPGDLEHVISPVAAGAFDYVKGNRFVHAEARRMPVVRRLAGRILSLATRAASGLDVDDCQCGYTALSAAAARELPLDELWPRFGYPNDLLVMLAARGLRVSEVSVRPVYADETSGIRPWHGALVLALIARRAYLERERLNIGAVRRAPSP